MKMDSATNIPCDLCDQHSNSVAYGRCLDCEENLCQSCCTFHERSKTSKHHRICDLGTLDLKEKGKIRQRFFCDKHPGEEIKLVCQVCNVIMCVLCKAVNHDTHASKTIADKVAEWKHILEAELHTCENTLRRLSLAAQEHEELDKILNDAEKREIEAIDKQHAMLLKVLENEVNRKKEKVQTVYMEYRQTKVRNAAFIQKESMRCIMAMTDLRKVINEGTSIDILKKGPALKNTNRALIIPEPDKTPRKLFISADVKPQGIMAFLLGTFPKQRTIVELEDVQTRDVCFKKTFVDTEPVETQWSMSRSKPLAAAGNIYTRIIATGRSSGIGMAKCESLSEEQMRRRSASRAKKSTLFQPNEGLIQSLQALGFSRNACIKGLYYTGNFKADLAIEWIIQNQNDKHLDGPLEDPYKCWDCGEKKEAALVCITCKSTKVELLKGWAS